MDAAVTADPDRYVELDEETPQALLDQRRAGKKLVLITNYLFWGKPRSTPRWRGSGQRAVTTLPRV